MRKEFLQAVEELEYQDRLFQAALSSRVMMATSLETWAVSREVAEKLFELVNTYKPRKILEIGTSLGYSTLWLAEAARAYGGVVTTIEHEESKVQKARRMFEEVGLADTITQIQGNASAVLSQWESPIGFLFIDAKKREYRAYIEAALPWLAHEALVVADDVIEWKRKLADFLLIMEDQKRFETSILPIGHGLLISKKV